ncbi:MAG: hypothetical protein ACJ74J_11680 [Blastocatellia bacterium]
MSKTFACLIILLGLALAFNTGIGIIGPLVWLFIIGSAFSALLHKKPVSHFIGVLLGLIIGPVIICYMVRLLLAHLRGPLASGPSSLSTAVLLLLLMAISFFYARHKLLGRSKHEAKELQTNERRPILPPHTDAEEDIGHHARD